MPGHRISLRPHKAVLFIFILFAFLSCSYRVQNNSPPEEPVFVTATVDEASGLSRDLQTDILRQESTHSKPWVNIGPDEILVQNLEMNLDIDVADEQILVLKKKNDNESPIYIAIVDFDPVLNIYRRTWQYTTAATNVLNFSVSLSDVIGDHKMEIVCFGSDHMDRQTLSILWRSRSSDGPELVYESVCDISAAGSIEIIEKPRSEAYEAGMKDGDSFSIVTLEHSSGSENILDIVKSTYFWDFKSRSFLKMGEEFIPGEKIAEARLARLLQGSNEAFIDFFNGPWHISGREGDSAYEDTLLFFETENNRMVLFSGNVQEIYRWEDISRSLKNSLFFQGSNELMPYVTNEVYIRIENMDSITVTVRDIDSHTRIKTTNDIWSGTYVRLKNSSWRQIISGNHPDNKDQGVEANVNLSGQYMSDEGSRLVFNKPEFTLYREGRVESGFYSMYRNISIFMEMRVMDTSNVVVRSYFYRLEYKETTGSTEIVRTLLLTPGRMSADGFVLSGDAPRRYEQIESVESDS